MELKDILIFLIVLAGFRGFWFVLQVSNSDENLSSWENIKNWLKSL